MMSNNDPEVSAWISELKMFLQNSPEKKVELSAQLVPLPVMEKRHVNVDVRIHSLLDLIELAEQAKLKWDYGNPELTFSVDFARLQSILPELKELNSMVGLVSFKRSIVLQIVYFLQGLDRNEKGEVIDYKHMVLCGPPGVGKTEVAKTVGRLFLAMGALSSNVFKKTTRSDLVGGYLGQTAIKTAGVIQSCLGGVLFIDEAYSLWDNGREKQDAYAREAIDTLCEAMSCHKADLMVIIAGYQEEIDAFLEANRGLESRFLWRHVLETLSPDELAAVFDLKVAEAGWKREAGSWVGWFTKNKAEFTGSGRCIEKLLSFAKMSHAKRIFGKAMDKEITTKELSTKDRDDGFALFMEQKKVDKKGTPNHQFYFV